MPLFAKKSLGQHFLNSPHVLGQIIAAAQIQKDETVLEIGPGTGILTRALLDAGAKVVAVEKDDRAIDFLTGIFGPELAEGRLKLIHGDILKLRTEQGAPLGTKGVLSEALTANTNQEFPPSPYAVVANIPYYITGSILQTFLEYSPRPNRMILLVQKEVAERIVAKPHEGGTGKGEYSGKESILSISVKAFGEPKLVAKVPRGAFTPAPNVDSAILAIENISDQLFKENDVEIPRFFEILKAGFAHKRKFVIRNLETVINPEKIKAIWFKLELSDKVRAEDMSLGEWFQIVSTLI